MRFSWGSWTLYTDIVVPFTNYAICLDLGLHFGLGYRYR